MTLGYDVRVVYDPMAALALAPTFNPAVCLLDIGLPVMDGYELASRMRASNVIGGDTRLIAVTGYGQDADRLRAREAGFDSHIAKPVTMDALSQAFVRPPHGTVA